MAHIRWVIGIICAALATAGLFLSPTLQIPRWAAVLCAAAFLCLWRMIAGPTNADRAASLKVVSVIIIAFCGALALVTGLDLYLDIALAWAIQAFVGTLLLAKYIEGRQLDD